ncbi:hypothetical protein INR77_02900 [Erythrobacter sp. SCSIO 43205]|uniref:hypothetical protein n=1 Tax=Erythrobacter sp. SCSIO 43205 TaxID=2779361 RepID=UPI001CA9CC29|nr:hypothetical protein [Erythrobacter sp. SCSIO 43205]UAB78695.1 hypothetical protein INR77_02900 [Erythrobacter sp. SCSIO 43205]
MSHPCSLRHFSSLGITTALAVTLGACASSGPRGPSEKVIDRVLASAPGEAQPSTIVSTEIAYAKAARQDGLGAAMAEYAAPGAQIHTGDGLVPAQAGAITKEQWAPRVVVKSCDGSLALSQGRFADATGKVGNYITTWQRQPEGDFKWSYEVSGLDDPQPPPRKQFEDGDIVVTALDVVKGLIATCPREGEPTPPPPPIPVGEGGASAAQTSRDGTLRWRWEQREGGTKYVTAEYYFQGKWVTAIEESLASPSE